MCIKRLKPFYKFAMRVLSSPYTLMFELLQLFTVYVVEISYFIGVEI